MAYLDFDGFDDPLALEAADIVKNLLSNDEFFINIFGTVLQKIAASSSLITQDVTKENLLNLRAMLICSVSVEEVTSTTPVYMECDAGKLQIFINPMVCLICGLFQIFAFLL
jgi:hypothetical protein